MKILFYKCAQFLLKWLRKKVISIFGNFKIRPFRGHFQYENGCFLILRYDEWLFFVSPIQTCLTPKENQTFRILKPPYHAWLRQNIFFFFWRKSFFCWIFFANLIFGKIFCGENLFLLAKIFFWVKVFCKLIFLWRKFCLAMRNLSNLCIKYHGMRNTSWVHDNVEPRSFVIS